jgi:methionine biosynthesis protein MetW
MKNPSSTFQENIYNTEAPLKIVEVKDLRVREIMRKLLGKNRCKVLDVGCGDGSLLEPFCRSQECYGVDVSEAQLKKAQKKGIRTYRVDLESGTLPFADDFFDLVICSETIEHLLDPDNLLQEIHRTVRCGGSFILTFPNMNQPLSWLMQVAFDLPPRFSARYKSPHVRDYTLRIMKNVLVNFGFEISNVTGTYLYPYEGKISQWLATSFPRLAEKIIVVSEKHRKTVATQPKNVVWNVLELLEKKTRQTTVTFMSPDATATKALLQGKTNLKTMSQYLA